MDFDSKQDANVRVAVTRFVMGKVGMVKWFSESKGFGFITIDGEPDHFVHYGSISGEGFRTLEEGQRVQFDSREGDRGLYAENVVKL